MQKHTPVPVGAVSPHTTILLRIYLSLNYLVAGMDLLLSGLDTG